MVGGTISNRGPEFLVTPYGVWAIRMSANSDNSLEQAAHDRAGAVTVIVDNDEELHAFFAAHGYDDHKQSMAVFKTLVYERLV
jgi:hypothetical protein